MAAMTRSSAGARIIYEPIGLVMDKVNMAAFTRLLALGL